MQRIRRGTTVGLGGALALLGIAMIVTTLARGGGALALGLLVGVAFTILGSARAYLAVGPRAPRRRR